ncbi:MAG: pilus assembly protein PilM [Minisyncoccota bacterium]
MQRSKFFQFFPPPRFLQRPAVGLDISDTSMRFVELLETRHGLVLGRFGERAIPQGIIESGEVKKPAELRTLISGLKKDYDLDLVAVSLPEEKAYLFDLHLPKIKQSEIRGAIELSLEEYVPLKVTEALFDYDIEKETDTTIQVSVSVIPRTLIDGYLEAFSGTGVTPIAFEIEDQSIVRAVVPEGDNGTYMVVDFGKTRTGIAIVDKGFVQFTSTVSVGGTMLTEAIAKNLSISYEEAEKIKYKEEVFGTARNEKLSLALVSTISILRDSINKHYTYWQTHDDHGQKRAQIKNIYLCGGDSNLAGFVNYLAVGLPVPVELAQVMVNVNSLDRYVPEISFNDSLRYATAIGLALRRPR